MEASVLDMRNRQKANVTNVERQGGVGNPVWLEKWVGAGHAGLRRFIGLAEGCKQVYLYPKINGNLFACVHARVT